MKSEQQYIDLFQECRQILGNHSCPVLDAPRDAAFQTFCHLGLPTRKDERYKYTDVQKAFAPNYGLNLNRLNIPVNPYDVFRCDVPNMSTLLYFLVNDAFHTKESPKIQPNDGVLISSLKEAAQQHPKLVSKYYTLISGEVESQNGNEKAVQYVDGEFIPIHRNNNLDSITALNTMFAQDGLFVYIPKNTTLDHTVQIINILHAQVDLMVNRRVLIVLEEGAQGKILFCDHAMDDVNFLTTQVIEVYAAPGSSLEFYELEETHTKNKRFSNLYVKQATGSRVVLNSLTLHNGFTRNMTYVALTGEKAETHLYGGVVADKQQHVDNATLVDHQAPKCVSDELYKYVLDEHSTGAFAGKVLVRKESQQTESLETNANLVASSTAHMYTQPMLEIYADDVKCNHGATVGQFNEQALFYMRQRGISLEEAQLLLKVAFVDEVIDRVNLEPLRNRLHYLVEKRFRGELNKCVGCKLCQ